MTSSSELKALLRGTAAFGLSAAFLHDLHVIGRGTAVQNLSVGLKREGLWLGQADEELLGRVRNGTIELQELQAAICSFERTGYSGDLPPDAEA